MKEITLIREINCYDSTPSAVNRIRLATGLASSVPCRTYASVWLAFAPLDRVVHDYTKLATRIIGPVPADQAESVIQQLEMAFESAGFHVTIDTTADD